MNPALMIELSKDKELSKSKLKDVFKRLDPRLKSMFANKDNAQLKELDVITFYKPNLYIPNKEFQRPFRLRPEWQGG